MQGCGHTPIWSEQRVERTNARGRHVYVPAFKRWMIEQAKLPGMSMAGLAMSNQVNANQLRRWVQLDAQQRIGKGRAAALLPVTIAAQGVVAPAAAPAVAVEIEFAGALVRVREGMPAATLRMVLDCLRTMP